MSVQRLLCAWAAMGMLLCAAPASYAQMPLQPSELLQSVERSLPLLERARRDVELADGQLEQARGGFDVSLKSSVQMVRGFFDNDRISAIFEQPVAALGLTTYGGYRTGRGAFAPYDTRSQTLSDGEITGGLELPLLRNRAIDPRRAERDVASLGVGLARESLDKARLSFYKDALFEYWDWVAAGRQLEVARAMLDLAEARDQQLADGVALGQIALVERTDNRRAILQRRSAMVSAERQLQMKTIDLSLYYRTLEGAPERPGTNRLPPLPAPAEPSAPRDEDAAIRLALLQRPELRVLRTRREQLAVEVRLADNAVLPSLDVRAEANRDFGIGQPSRVHSALEAGVWFSVPLQNRRATGKQAQARAKVSGLEQELRWAEDQVRADVQDAISALGASGMQLAVVSEELAVARELESLERDRFALGDSTQFLVNLRELATADAALRETRARADYQKALVTVDATTGRLLARVPRP